MSSGSPAVPSPTPTEAPESQWRHFLTPENRYLAPAFITTILLVGHLAFGILESIDRTALAIAVGVAAEAVIGRITYGRWPHLASAYITGISVGILIRSPLAWPYVLCSLLSIMSKYVLRVKGRHIWNPSNFGVCVMLFLAPWSIAVLSIQWGNSLWPMVVIWVLGAFIVHRLGRLHISAAYVGSFLAYSLARSMITGNPWLTSVAPITGPMYQLFIFFMITDPRTTVQPKWGHYTVAVLVATVEAGLRLGGVVYAPFYALFAVGPPAMLIDLRARSKHLRVTG